MAKHGKSSSKRLSKKSRKRLKDFLTNDEGKIKKKDLAKLGLSLATLATLAQSNASGYELPVEQTEGGGCGGCGSYTPHTVSTIHTNYFFSEQETAITGAGGHMSGLSHGSHGSHASHGSHGSHASHGQW